MRIIDGTLKLGAVIAGAIIVGGGSLAAIAAVVGGGAQGSFMGDQLNQNQPDGEIDSDPTDGPWQGRSVKIEMQTQNLTGDGVSSGTIHVFREKPTDSGGQTVWENPRTIDTYFGSEQEMDQVSISSDTTTLQYTPGEYFYVIESSGYETQFGSFVVPDGDGVPAEGQAAGYEGKLTDYNQEPAQVNPNGAIQMSYKHDASYSALDLGVSSDTSNSVETYTASADIEPDEGTVYAPWKLVASVGSVDPTTDSDNDGNYDEGIQRISLSTRGTCSKSKVLFDASQGIDRFENGEIELDLESLDCETTAEGTLTFEVEVETFSTGTGTASDGDETLQDGENFLDLQMFRADSNPSGLVDATA